MFAFLQPEHEDRFLERFLLGRGELRQIAVAWVGEMK